MVDLTPGRERRRVLVVLFQDLDQRGIHLATVPWFA